MKTKTRLHRNWHHPIAQSKIFEKAKLALVRFFSTLGVSKYRQRRGPAFAESGNENSLNEEKVDVVSQDKDVSDVSGVFNDFQQVLSH
jgi:hypothetical protein